MPPPESLHLLVPVAAAMALLLVGGVAALVHLGRGGPADAAPWRLQLARFAAASPWRRGDLAALLALLALAQLLRSRLPESLTAHVLAFQGVVLAGVLWRARRKTRPFGDRLPLRTVAGQALLRWLAILPVLWFSAFVSQLLLDAWGHPAGFQEAIRYFLESSATRQRVALVLFAVGVAPVAEELLFRGVLLPLLVRGAGAAAGLALTAIGFAALHGHLGTFVPLAAISVALSLAYARTGSLLVPMAMHALFNGVNLALLGVLVRAGVV